MREGGTNMTRLVVETEIRRKLLDLNQRLDFCDESGRLLGTFIPTSERLAAERARPPISKEELQRRRNEPDYTTDEVIAHLESL